MPLHRRHSSATHTRQTPLRAAISRLRTLVRAGARSERGNVLVTFAFALIPLLGMVGAAIDYSRAARVRTQMLAAADAAALGAVAKSSPAITAATAMTSDGPVPVGVEDAKKIFNGQLPSNTTYSGLTIDATVVKTSGSVDSVVQFSANVPTMILGILSWSAITVAGVSKASASLPRHIDFHLLLDNTPSMGVGATTADIAKMVANTTDKCAFACHDLSTPGKDYYSLAKKLGVQMRIDVLRTATQQLMDTAQSTQVFPGQFRVAIHTFGAAGTNPGLTTIQQPTSDLAAAKNSASAIDLMTVPYQNYKSDTLTDFHDVVSDVETAVGSSGNGSTPATAQKVLFFVSDGVADRAIGSPACSRSTTNGQDPKTKTNYKRCQEPFDPNLCDAMKTKRNVKIAVLYTTYLPLPTNDWYNDWIKPFQSQIRTKMKSCASSPELYLEVSPSGGINGIADALEDLFKKAVSGVRLTQ